ncbi:Mog1p/PsbP-like protein [Poronia punctata]|nr:Mog1p/PsbP-like protein [Poronia punctata]
MASYESTPLFHGAIVCDLPTSFTNVRNISKAYPIPNHQEVFIAKDGFMSIIIDIFDRVDESDDDALTTHLEDVDAKLVEQEGTRQRTNFTKLPTDIPAYTLLAKLPPSDPATGGSSSSSSGGAVDPSEMPDTMVMLTLLRLERENTDMVITVNVLNIRSMCAEEDEEERRGRGTEGGDDNDEDKAARQMAKRGKIIGDAASHAGRIWESFDIRDWDLFRGPQD